MIAWHILIIDQTNAMDMAKQVRYSNLVILVLIVGFLCCIASSSAAITEKSVKNLNKLENKNQSVNKLMSKSNVGLTLFDGKAIIQNESVMTQAKYNMTIIENLHSEVSEQSDYHNWTLRQYADYAADPSHSIGYTITATDGWSISTSSDLLGYSKATDQIIGEKNKRYYFWTKYLLDDELGPFNKEPYQWRLTIYPNENQLIIQEYGYEEYETNPSPIKEYMIPLSKMARGRFGGPMDEHTYLVVLLIPIPAP